MKLLLFIIACGLGWSTWHFKTLGEEASKFLDPVEAERQRLSVALREEQTQHQRLVTVSGREIQDLKSRLAALTSEYEAFKVQRRADMIGKSFPSISLGHGQSLQNARITAVDAATITFKHDGGLSRVPLKDLGEDLKWQAVWTEKEAGSIVESHKVAS